MDLKLAIPTNQGLLCDHFGHCEKFAILEVKNNQITQEEFAVPPDHQPGIYPGFLKDLGVDVVLAAGMGSRALQLFAGLGIKVCTGVRSAPPRLLAEEYIQGKLVSSSNLCDH